jgi:hypothetical protein
MSSMSSMEGTRIVPGLFTEREEAKQLGVSIRSLRRWRRTGYGPRYVQIGRFVYYAPTAHADFLDSQEKAVELPAPRSRLRRRG